MSDDPRKGDGPLYGESDEEEAHYGTGGEAAPDVADPDAARREGREHARDSGERAERSEGGGGQEGI